jgi:predicted DNA-binding transcriptional regulator AlpA
VKNTKPDYALRTARLNQALADTLVAKLTEKLTETPAQGPPARWLRRAHLARYMGTSAMSIWRWEKDPSLAFPQPSIINGIKYFDRKKIDAWLQARVVV